MENQNLTPQQQKELDTVNWRIDFQQKTMERLRTDPAIQEYFTNFNEVSVEQFMTSYCLQKTNWYQYAELHQQLQEKDELRWIEEAFWHMELIQQKKLFDLQCLWRAEHIQLPGVELCVDFGYWQENVLNCPFVDPITEEEIELYREYLAGNDVQLREELYFSFFQNYEGIKDAHQSEGEDGNMFEWYEFYNSRKGTEHYLSLPNIRGRKEAYYIALARSTNPEKQAAIAEMQRAFAHRPGDTFIDRNGKEMLNAYSPETLSYFINKFEDKQTREYYKAAKWFSRNHDEKDQLDNSIDLLLSANEEIPIGPHHDWKEAIHEAARRYTIRKISEMMHEAYEQYRMNISMNISFPCRNKEQMTSAKKTVMEDILLGRKLNGDPEDLNF